MIIAAAFLAGCTRSSEQGGRSGNDTFRVSVPAIATAINQGEMQIVRITLDRGDGFKQPVKLDWKAPAGITVEPGDAMVQPGDKGDVQVKVTVAKDAPIGTHKILVRGTPTKGEPTETEFTITVSAK